MFQLFEIYIELLRVCSSYTNDFKIEVTIMAKCQYLLNLGGRYKITMILLFLNFCMFKFFFLLMKNLIDNVLRTQSKII